MERRAVLKIIALGAMMPGIESLGVAPHCSIPEGTAWTPGDYKLQFFTPAENELVDKLAEIIIPADAHSPGAHAAQVSLFADLMVATSNDAVKDQWREGLRSYQEAVAKSSPAGAIAQAAANEERPTTDVERFFVVLKQMTVNGYYTSKIGIDQDMEYIQNIRRVLSWVAPVGVRRVSSHLWPLPLNSCKITPDFFEARHASHRPTPPGNIECSIFNAALWWESVSFSSGGIEYAKSSRHAASGRGNNCCLRNRWPSISVWREYRDRRLLCGPERE